MICIFHVKKKNVYIKADSIIGVMPDTTTPKKAVVYCDPPIEQLLVDEDAETAYVIWAAALYDVEDDEEEEEEPAEEAA